MTVGENGLAKNEVIISVFFTLIKISQLINKKLPIKATEEYYTTRRLFISNIVIPNGNSPIRLHEPVLLSERL